MTRFKTGTGPDQLMMMPADPREWLPAGHLAWRLLELAAEMDLSGFGAGYRADGQGGRPYDPAMMATLLVYCYCRGRRSCREIEMATYDDVGARLICGGLHPDHSTVAEFVRRHLEAVCGLLPESVRQCAREGLVSLDLVAGDGTKLKANASMASNVTAAELDAQIAGLEAVIAAEFTRWTQDMLGAETPGDPGRRPGSDPVSGPGGTDGAAGKEPKRARQTLARRRAAREQLEARQEEAGRKEQDKARARAADLAARVERKEAAAARWEAQAAARLAARAAKTAAGRRVGGTRPITSIDDDREVKRARQALATARADHQAALAAAASPAAPASGPGGKVNTADPASRVMPLKKGGYDQLFNVQALATAGTQVILAVTRHDNPSDTGALAALMARARQVLDAAGITGEILAALFDAGYASDANFTLGIAPVLYIAVTREARQTGRSPDGRDPQTMLPSWETMTARLQTPEGKALYRQRAGTIEPVFAQLTARLGRTLHYRGSAVDAELALWAASHNILKAIKARTRRTARGAAAPAPALAAA
jgi:transposase